MQVAPGSCRGGVETLPCGDIQKRGSLASRIHIRRRIFNQPRKILRSKKCREMFSRMLFWEENAELRERRSRRAKCARTQARWTRRPISVCKGIFGPFDGDIVKRSAALNCTPCFDIIFVHKDAWRRLEILNRYLSPIVALCA